MKWIFRQMQPDEVESEITQRDDFRNDEVDLSDTIVREAIQNSQDARMDEKVSVRFSMLSEKDGLDPNFFRQVISEKFELHAKSANLDISDVDFNKPSVLLIEDFGTTGLTGATDDRDNDHFSDFWRRHGRSHKTGSSGGRWGLGKLVFSISSQVSSFFGLTIQQDNSEPLLMGQAVLNYHSINGTKYAPHGYFADIIEEGPEKGLPVPIRDSELRDLFMKNLKIDRNIPGLSIAIPFPNADITTDAMIGVAIINYFFPILTGKLILDFNGTIVDSSSIRELAIKYAKGKISDTNNLFQFIDEINQFPASQVLSAKPEWTKDGRLTKAAFLESDLIKMRTQFINKKTIGVNLPVTIKERNGDANGSSIKVYLKNPVQLSKGMDMYIRSSITIPGESKFHHRKALGALITSDLQHDPVATFLGDAENAAHTRWNSKAGKLKKYVKASDTLKVIRNSIQNLYDLLDQSIEEENEDALKDFFWIPKENKPKGEKRKKKKPVIPPLQSSPKPFQLTLIAGGISISPKDPISPSELPITCWVKLAYDLVDRNPFAQYEKYDFNLKSSDQFKIESKGISYMIQSANLIGFVIRSNDFKLIVKGFDQERDLIIRAGTAS